MRIKSRAKVLRGFFVFAGLLWGLQGQGSGQKKRAGPMNQPFVIRMLCDAWLFAIAKQVQQHHEHVDKVQIQA